MGVLLPCTREKLSPWLDFLSGIVLGRGVWQSIAALLSGAHGLRDKPSLLNLLLGFATWVVLTKLRHAYPQYLTWKKLVIALY